MLSFQDKYKKFKPDKSQNCFLSPFFRRRVHSHRPMPLSPTHTRAEKDSNGLLPLASSFLNLFFVLCHFDIAFIPYMASSIAKFLVCHHSYIFIVVHLFFLSVFFSPVFRFLCSSSQLSSLIVMLFSLILIVIFLIFCYFIFLVFLILCNPLLCGFVSSLNVLYLSSSFWSPFIVVAYHFSFVPSDLQNGHT